MIVRDEEERKVKEDMKWRWPRYKDRKINVCCPDYNLYFDYVEFEI